MKARYFAALSLLICLNACKKSSGILPLTNNAVKGFVTYTIKKNEHYSDKSEYKPVSYEQLSFIVLFDSSAIYQTITKENQYDINKLFGFSDNGANHHLFSARIGWRWSDGALRLFGYIYNNGVVQSQELGTISLNREHQCSISISGNQYLFAVDKQITVMPRQSTSAKAEGYQLYPYFGGDEKAPHEIVILIRQL